MAAVIYRANSDVVFLAAFAYAIGFVANIVVPKSIDVGGGGAFIFPALIVDVILLGLFAIQYSVVVRQGFKRRSTQFVPRPMPCKLRFHAISAIIKSSAVALLFAGLFSGAALADEVPVALAGTTVVGAEDVVKAVAGGAVLIDARVASEYAEGHIKGARNVPYGEKSAKTIAFDASQDQFDLTKLPADKGAAIVVYCNGPECWKSYKASVAAVKAGYTNVHWYRVGFPDWKSKGLPIESTE